MISRTGNLIFLLASVLLYGCSTMKAIDEGLYEVAEAVSDKDLITGERALNFRNRQSQITSSTDVENNIINDIVQSGGKINQDLDPDAYTRLNYILHKLISVSHLKNETWTVYLIPYEGFNAFVVGGQSIFVHYDLVRQIKNDDELAIVLGHEIAHVAANHIYEKEAQFITLQIAGSKSISKEGYMPAYVINDEREADMIGIMYASLAGFNPYSASELWERLSHDESNLTLYYRSHPKSIERATNNAEFANVVKEYYLANKINPEADDILKCNKLWCNKNNELNSGEGGGILALLTVVANSLIAHGQAKYEKQLQEVEIAKSQEQLTETVAQVQPEQTTNTVQPATEQNQNEDSSLETPVIAYSEQTPKTYMVLTVLNNIKIYDDVYIGKVQFNDNEEELELITQFLLDENSNLIAKYEFILDEKKYHGKLINPIMLNTKLIQLEYDFHDEFNNGQLVITFDNDGTYFHGGFKNIPNRSVVKMNNTTNKKNTGYRNISKKYSGNIDGKLIGE